MSEEKENNCRHEDEMPDPRNVVITKERCDHMKLHRPINSDAGKDNPKRGKRIVVYAAF